MADLGLISFGNFTVDTGTNELLITAHGVFDGNVVRVASSGTLPGGLAAGTDYWVVGSTASADRFQVALTPGGAAVDITSAGTGTHTAYRVVAAMDGDLVMVQASQSPPFLPWSFTLARRGDLSFGSGPGSGTGWILGFAELGNISRTREVVSPPWRLRSINDGALYHAIGGRDNNVGNPNPPSILIKGKGYFPIRWVIRPGVRSIQVKVKQSLNGLPRPSIAIIANPSVGLNADVEVFAPPGTDWVTCGPASFTATANGLVFVQLRGNYDGQMAECWFDKCDGS